MSKARRPAEIAAEIAVAMMWKACTRRELCEHLGAPQKSSLVDKYIGEFRASGCVFVESWDSPKSPRFRWQPTPFKHEDAPRPEAWTTQQGGREAKLIYTFRGEEKTIRQLADMAGCSYWVMWSRLGRRIKPEAAVAMGKPQVRRPRAAASDAQHYVAARGLV